MKLGDAINIGPPIFPTKIIANKRQDKVGNILTSSE